MAMPSGGNSVVTGANRGLGLEFARQLLARGDRVAAGCRAPDAAAELQAAAAASEGRLVVLPLDVADPASRAAFVAAVSARMLSIDLLVNNAGRLVSGERFGQVEQDAMTRTFAVNVAGPFLLAQAFAARLAAGTRARVVNVSSSMGSIAQLSGFVAPSYSISKTALNMATAQLAHALNPQGVGVLAISPGWVRTAMGGDSAPLTPARSVASMLATIAARPGVPAGEFVDHDGTALPW